MLRVVAVASLGPAAAFAGLVAAHALGRGAAVVTMGVVPVARPDGLGAEFARSVRRRPRRGRRRRRRRASPPPATGWWAGRSRSPRPSARRRRGRPGAPRAFGGITGDILGAVEQVAECLVLVTVTGLAARHAVWWT